MDTAVSSINNTSSEEQKDGPGFSREIDPSYSKIDDSFFVHVKPQEANPVGSKAGSEHTNTIYENLFGSNITVTKLLDK